MEYWTGFNLEYGHVSQIEIRSYGIYNSFMKEGEWVSGPDGLVSV